MNEKTHDLNFFEFIIKMIVYYYYLLQNLLLIKNLFFNLDLNFSNQF